MTTNKNLLKEVAENVQTVMRQVEGGIGEVQILKEEVERNYQHQNEVLKKQVEKLQTENLRLVELLNKIIEGRTLVAVYKGDTVPCEVPRLSFEEDE